MDSIAALICSNSINSISADAAQYQVPCTGIQRNKKWALYMCPLTSIYVPIDLYNLYMYGMPIDHCLIIRTNPNQDSVYKALIRWDKAHWSQIPLSNLFTSRQGINQSEA